MRIKKSDEKRTSGRENVIAKKTVFPEGSVTLGGRVKLETLEGRLGMQIKRH